MRTKDLVAILGLSIVMLVAARAEAYCRASTCAEGLICGPPPWDDPSCKPLAWMRPCVGVSLQAAASEEVPLDVATTIVDQSFLAWEQATCDDASGGKPSIHVVNTGVVDCDLIEYNSKGGNANIVTFRDAAWPHPAGPHNIALTTVTFDTKTGEIYDADMEINSAGFTLTSGDTDVQTDLLSVVTHEAGHFLGLSHSEIPEATMWANYTPGTISPRVLTADDVGGICQIYPPSDPIDPALCNPLPRHGFSPACLSKQTEGDCSVKSAAGEERESDAGVFLVAMAALAGVRRVRTGSRRART